MKIIRSLNKIAKTHPSLALTIGNFDGIHLGHLEIIDKVKKLPMKKYFFCGFNFWTASSQFFKIKII